MEVLKNGESHVVINHSKHGLAYINEFVNLNRGAIVSSLFTSLMLIITLLAILLLSFDVYKIGNFLKD